MGLGLAVSIWHAVAMFDELIRANDHYAANFRLAGLPARAGRGIGVLTCIDTRIEPLPMLGLRPGDAKILRNAGGRVTPDVLRSLALATSYLGVTHVVVVHHTDCAVARLDEAAVRAGFSDAQLAATEGWDFCTMADPDRALADDVEAIRSCAALADGVVTEGWRYDVESGRIHRIVTASDTRSDHRSRV